MGNEPLMITTLASGDQTSGHEVFHQYGPEGTGPGPHFHPWDEAFFVLSGEVACGIDGVDTVVGAGELVSMTSKGEASALYETFAREGNWTSPDRTRLVSLAARHGQTVVAPSAE